MPRLLVKLTLSIAAAGAAVVAGAEDRRDAYNPRAIELFERDLALMNWAVKQFDSDGDRVISIAEANQAARAFREIADGDGDGRVTPYEYDRAREFIIARY